MTGLRAVAVQLGDKLSLSVLGGILLLVVRGQIDALKAGLLVVISTTVLTCYYAPTVRGVIFLHWRWVFLGVCLFVFSLAVPDRFESDPKLRTPL